MYLRSGCVTNGNLPMKRRPNYRNLSRPTRSMNVELLPDVVILEIFRYLSFVDLCKAARVCSRWRRVSRDRSLRKIIRIGSLPVDLAPKFIKFHCTSDLVGLSFTLHEEREMPKLLPMRFLTLLNTRSPNLKQLSLDNYYSESCLNLYSCIKFLPDSVTHLSLCYNKFHDSLHIYYRQFNEIKKPNVEYVSVNRCEFQIESEVNFLQCFPNLTELHMEAVSFYAFQFMPQISDMGKNLRILNLESTRADYLFKPFWNCLLLEELYLGHNEDSVNDALLQDLPELPNLHTLCVANTNVKLRKSDYQKKFKKLTHFFSRKGGFFCNHKLKVLRR